MKLAIALLLITTPAFGLGVDQTMRGWKTAAVEDRAQLLKDVLLDLAPADRRRLLYCMDQSANTKLLLSKSVSEMIALCLRNPD